MLYHFLVNYCAKVLFFSFHFLGKKSEGYILSVLCKQKWQILESTRILPILITTHIQNLNPYLFYPIPMPFLLSNTVFLYNQSTNHKIYLEGLCFSNKFIDMVNCYKWQSWEQKKVRHWMRLKSIMSLCSTSFYGTCILMSF